ncbi:ribosomal protein S18-alanine N-acetyltransferase [Oceanobacter mangrovi]|uniref:ribosomal protein S18-alanine N-acetyltransferase n=1 Tax=Oceanobacter mangrovi TaxID=2862510 RepID=UPI001C8E2909|nr:ribosomal protein S18-alanine N-acetyltransferase [Oceanobacter mangrovi]
MSSDLQFRPAGLDDLDAIMAIEQASHFHPWSRSVMERYLGKAGASWKLLDGQQLLGFAVCPQIVGEAELMDIAIDPAQQGKGHGQWLLQQLLQQVMDDGCERMFLDVRESNAPAIAVYEKLGFCQVGVRPNYYPTATGKEDALLYCQELVL